MVSNLYEFGKVLQNLVDNYSARTKKLFEAIVMEMKKVTIVLNFKSTRINFCLMKNLISKVIV